MPTSVNVIGSPPCGTIIAGYIAFDPPVAQLKTSPRATVIAAARKQAQLLDT